jgi:Regulator of chromosome condensation (RCC1) repeat
VRAVSWILIGLAGCADRPIDLPLVDLGAAHRDLSEGPADLAVPDLALPDLSLARDLSAPRDLLPVEPVVCAVNPCALDVALAGQSSCARLSDGTVRCWGDNGSAQLGFGTVSGSPPVVSPSSRPSPAPVAGVSGATDVGLGGFFSGMGFGCALARGNVACWGSDQYGELGRGGPNVNAVLSALTPGPYETSPAPVVNLALADEIALGGAHGCARLGGAVSCWGSTNGADFPPSMGGTGYPVFYRPTAFTVPLPRPVRRIFTGGGGGQDADGNVTCAIFDDASVGCWGDDSPILVGSADSFGVHAVAIPAAAQLALGYRHACAVTTAGEVWCWGDPTGDGRGALPLDAGMAFLDTPNQVSLPQSATQVTAGVQSTCALFTGGGVACWGNNDHGQAGQAALATVPLPELVTGLADVVRLSTGSGRHVCAIQKSGRVLCWGSGDAGGLGGPPSSFIPTEIDF